MNNNLYTSQATPEPLDIEMEQAEETVPEPQYRFSNIKLFLQVVLLVSLTLMLLISVLLKRDPVNVSYILAWLVYMYAILVGCFLVSIYSKAIVHPLRSICVIVLEASYYISLLLSLSFSLLFVFPHAKYVIFFTCLLFCIIPNF